MASKNKTENLKLSQWEAGDAFTREDLNADFRAIDAAVGQGSGFVKLKALSLDADCETQLDIDVSDIDFTKWQYVMIDVTVSQSCNVKINGQSMLCSCWNICSSGQALSGCWGKAEAGTRLIFSPCGNSGKVTVISHGPEYLYFGSGPVMYSDINTVNFSLGSGNFLETAEFVIWGLK